MKQRKDKMLSFTPDIREGKGACKGQRGAGECTKDPAGWRAGVGGLATQGERQARELQPQGGMCKLPLPLRYWDPPQPPLHTHTKNGTGRWGGRCSFQGQGFQSKGEDTQDWETRRAEQAGSIQRVGSIQRWRVLARSYSLSTSQAPPALPPTTKSPCGPWPPRSLS